MRTEQLRCALERAQAVLRQWNAEHPDRVLPWEWLEEALLARRAWRLGARRARALRMAARERFHEFARRLPPGLVQHAMGRRWRAAPGSQR